MAEKQQVRLTGPDGTVVRVSEDEAQNLAGTWKSERKTPAKQAAKTDSTPKE